MAKLGRGRMPQLGSEIVDDNGLRLIHDWIRQLSPLAPGGSGAGGEGAARARTAVDERLLLAQLRRGGTDCTDAEPTLLAETSRGSVRSTRRRSSWRPPTSRRSSSTPSTSATWSKRPTAKPTPACWSSGTRRK